MLDIVLGAVYSLTSLLLWPVVLCLLFAVVHSAFLVGELWIEQRQRGKEQKAIRNLSDIPQVMLGRHGIRLWQQQSEDDPEADIWLRLDRTEAELARRMDRAKTWVRLGPMLGLCGTLIPLGPALVALAQNDLASLSEGLILAFGTTVMGLIAGGLAWVVMNTQQRWYRIDLAELRAAAESAEVS